MKLIAGSILISGACIALGQSTVSSQYQAIDQILTAVVPVGIVGIILLIQGWIDDSKKSP